MSGVLVTPTSSVAGVSTGVRTSLGMALISTSHGSVASDFLTPHSVSRSSRVSALSVTGSLRIMVGMTGAVSTGTVAGTGTLFETIVGVATLGLHPGDKSLLSLDIINSVLVLVGVESPVYTWYTSRIMALSPVTVSASPVTSGPCVMLMSDVEISVGP